MSAVAHTLSSVSPEKTATNPLGAGRNPRAGKPATVKVTIRLTETEHASYQAAATAEGLSLGEWLRAAAGARLPKPKRRRS